jgi:hypothetical protein
LNVRKNVVEMLRYLRKNTTKRYLWVDAICINQADAIEKGTQVSMMGSIYAQAYRVLIWLGAPSPTRPEPDILYAHDPSTMQILTLGCFIHRKWFGRRWVIQEVLQARTAFVVCGNVLIEFSDFVSRLTARLRITVSTRRIIRASDEEILEKLRYLISLRQMRGPVDSMGKRMAILLVQFHTAECTDARDRFYALNGISSNPVPVDYNVSVAEAYYHYACIEIMHCPVSLLSCAGAFRSDQYVSSNSWIPDWRRPLQRKPLQSSIECFPEGVRQNNSIRIQGKTIVLYALYEGTIKKVMHVTQDTQSRINDAQRFFEDYAKQENYFRQPPLRESDFNPIVANVLTAGAWLPPKLRENGNPPLDIRDRLEIPKLVESTMKGRTCYFTDSSRFGMGPGCIRKGDVLVSIPGGSSLIALRPLEYDAIYEASYQTRISHTETTMTVVGDCYVHGLHELMQQQLQKIECKYRIV